MRPEVRWIHPQETVEQAALLMDTHHVGWLPVCRDDVSPVGVITDRDIAVRVVAQGRVAGRTRVDEVMTAPAQTVRPDSSAEQACELMSKGGVTRLLVVDQQGHLDGVLSLSDLLSQGPTDAAVRAARAIRARASQERAAIARTVAEPPASSPPAEPSWDEDVPVDETETDLATRNPARAEADRVAVGGVNPLKEFPS